MHIPDGFMSVPVALSGWIFALPAIFWALYSSQEEDGSESVLAALLAASVFAAQTFQFPIPGGTTGHLVGATLVVILVGAPLGLLVLTSVVILQAVLFGDGGLLSLGWNLSNMGLVSGLVGGTLYGLFLRLKAPRFAAAVTAAWIATQLGAFCTAMELAVAGISPLAVSLAAMMSAQAITGLAEGLVTAGALVFLARARPGLVQEAVALKPGAGVVAVIGLASVAISFYLKSYLALGAFVVLLVVTLFAALVLGAVGKLCS